MKIVIARDTRVRLRRSILRGAALVAIVGFAATARAQTIQPLPALLPDKTSVMPGEPMPIDGMWRIDEVGARVRIEGGRIFALDSWVHLIIWKVLPGQIVTRDLERQSAGHYTGKDLPNQGDWTATLNGNQQLKVHIQGALGPIDVVLTALMPDSPEALRQEREKQTAMKQP
jgi:hypothetical protein